ncbi:MAG: four helix bundle protein, partial [Acidobacteriota bacterium]
RKAESGRQKAEGRGQKAEGRRQEAEGKPKKIKVGEKEECKKMKGHRDLIVFQLSYSLAMDIFNLSKKFPKEEIYSLTDQIRRSSRSVAVNIAEAFRKRRYPKMFVNKLSDSDAEATETQVWLDFAFDSGYLLRDDHDRLVSKYEEVGRMLGSMMRSPERFVPTSGR